MISTYKKLLALACVLVLLVCGLAACKSEPGAATTAAPLATEPAQVLPLEVYWNLDQELYDGKSEAGMSSRMPESDGYFHVRMFKDGQTLEVKVADRRVINHLDTLTMMGLEFDENGIVVDVIPVEELPMEKVGWQFYVQSVGGKIVKVNSANTMKGLEIMLELGENSKVYDMTGAEGVVGAEAEPIPGDRVYPIVDMGGNVTCIFIYKRDTYMQTHEAFCQHCQKEVTWKEWVKTDKMPLESGHFQLQNNIALNGQASMPEDCKLCLDLNGFVIDGKDGQRVVSMHNAGDELAIMDTSEAQTGAIRSHGELAGQGGVMYVRFGAFYLYGGTLDGSDAVNTYAGALMCINKGAYAYINGGTIKGGTAKYSLDANGKPGNGMGGNIRVLGKLVINDGLITGGKALAKATRKDGKTTYARGYGGNIYMGTGGTLEMNGGTVANGVAGNAGGNIYIDGTCDMTMNGGVIGSGRLTGHDRNGGNLFVGSKATFVMKDGFIRNGTVYNGGGNIYANGKVTISGGQIYGGKVIDKATGEEKAAVNNNVYVVNGNLRLYGGKISGGVTVTDSSTKDNQKAYLSMSGNVIIYGAAEGRSNLTLSSSGEKVLIRVGTLGKNAKIGISTTRGIFTQPRDEAEMEHFVSDIPGAEVVYYDGAYALGKLGCLCGKETHMEGCDGEQLLWSPWTSDSKLPNTTGNYYLTKPVTVTAQTSVNADQKVTLDLNGYEVIGDGASRIYSSYAEGASLTITDTKQNGAIKFANAESDLGGIVLVRSGASFTLMGGTLDASETVCVNTNGGGAVFTNTNGTFTMHGGTIKGATNTVGGGGAITVAKGGHMILTGGTVEGGKAEAAKGGNINVLGTLDMTGGEVKGGKAQYGGNIYVEGKMTLSGGSVTGGVGNTRNILVINGELEISGGQMDGGVTIDDRTAGDGVQTILRISGSPVITGASQNLNLSDRGDGATVYVGKMEAGAQVGVSAPGGVFTQPCEVGSENYFVGDQAGVDVVYYDGALALGKSGCLCGKAEHLPGCDQAEHFWMPWTGEGLPKVTGYWYLPGAVTVESVVNIPADQKVVLDLNGQTVTAENTRAYSVDAAGADLVITDRSAKANGTIKVTGTNSASALCVYVRNGNFTLYGGNLDASEATSTHTSQGGIAIWVNKNRTFTMYGGTVKGSHTACMNGGTIEVSSGGVMELHGGTVYGMDTTEALNGTAINVSGTLKVFGGTVDGGSTAGVGGTICVKGVMEMSGGTVTGGTTTGNGGNIYITDSGKMTLSGGTVENGSAKYGKNIFVDGKLTMEGGTVQNGNILVIDGEMTLSGGEILDTLSVDDRSATDSNKTLLTVSGSPKVNAIKLENRGDPLKLSVGALSADVKLSVNGVAGLFATVQTGVDADEAASHFASADSALKISRQADGLHLVDASAVYHCLCGQKPHALGCDGNEHLWQVWAKTNTKLPSESGYWYLEDNMTLTGTAEMPANAQVVLDLNGKTATRSGNRLYSVHNTGGSLVITDSTKEGKGTLKTTGSSSNAGLAIYVRNGDATLIRGILDAGEATSTNKTGGSAIWINKDRTFTMYGGTVIGGANTHASACGGAICVGAADAKMVMHGGTVKGGSVTSTGKGQTLYVIGTGSMVMTGGTVEGELYADGGLELSGKVNIQSLTVADQTLFAVGEVLGGSSITITGTGVVAQNVQTDVSASFTSANSGMTIVYDATAKTLVAQ